MLISVALAFVCTLALTPLVRLIARKRGWIAVPSGDRWHQKPTALMGGIAIFAGFSIPVLAVADFGSLLGYLFDHSLQSEPPSVTAVLWLGAGFLFLLGLLDDRRQIKPQTKLVGQILAAAIVVFFGFRLNWFTSLTLDTMVTLFWIIGITNAYNLLDNMDGLCSGIGLIAAFYLFFLLSPISESAAVAASALAGALAGFLVYNFKPASIFMGDCGSLVIGFSLAVSTLVFTEARAANPISVYAVPIMIQLVPIFDTTLVTLIRILSGRKASQGGRDHTSHRLVLMGFSERSAVLYLYLASTVTGVSAVFISRIDTLTSPVVIIPLLVAIVLLGTYLAQLRVYPEKEFSLLRARAYTPILIELTYKKQILLVLLDLGLLSFSYYLAYRLRFDTNEFQYYFKVFLKSLPAVIVCKFIALFIVGVYRTIWDYLSTEDILVQLKASILATIFSVVTVTFIYRFQDFSKGVFLIDFLLTTAFLLGTRGSFRLFFDRMKRKTKIGANVLIYGAGRGGELLLREILNNGSLKLKPVGFIDDDPLKKGKKLQGLPILGNMAEFEHLVHQYKVNGLLISFRSQGNTQFEEIKRLCHLQGIFLKRFTIGLNDFDL
jgi:UDP-GlcNAc:undecaprenyl-phosphate GlcNAc-1-phosphate transferase